MSFGFRTALTLILLAAPGLSQPTTETDSENIRFEGNSIFSRSELLSAIRFYDVNLGAGFEVTDADDAAYFLRLFYFDQGFPEATVEYAFTPDPSRATFEIDEGPREFIRHITATEGTAIPADQVVAIATNKVRVETRQPFGRLRFVEGALEDAASTVQGRFVQQGYLEANVEFSTTPAVDGQVDVFFEVDQGPQYRIRSVELEPMELLEETGLAENVKLPVGKIYRPGRETAVRTQVIDALNNVGFPDAQATVDVEIDRQAHRADIRINMTPGERYRIGSIRIEGSPRTSRRAIRQWMTFKAGDVYDAETINTTVRRMWFSGAFSDVSTQTETISDGELQLTLRFEDGRPKRLSLGTGYGQWERFYGRAEYTDQNFLGTLNQFQATLYGSYRTYGLQAQLSNAYFLGSDWTGTVRALATRRWVPAYRAFIAGASLLLTLRADDTKLTGVEFDYSFRSVFDSDVFGDGGDTVDGETFLENYEVGILSVRTTLDKRNDVLAPMKGYLLDNEIALATPAFLGDLSFFKIESQITYYVPFLEITPERPWVPFLALNSRVGVILPFAGTGVVPTQERFFLGGETTVRSFQYDGLGPRDSEGDPLGGQAFYLFNAELQLPVVAGFYVAVFTDIGNLAVEVDDLDWAETQVALGGGLRFYTPIGAIRADYGYNMNRTPGDPIGAWNFGFGFSF